MVSGSRAAGELRAAYLAKAHVARDAATVMETLQKSVMPRTRNMSPKAPPGLPMTTLKMYGKAGIVLAQSA